MVQVFSVSIFFVVFRETLETSVIVSVLLAFLKQTLGPEKDAVTYRKLVRQVWLGTIIGLVACIIIGAGMIGAFYSLKKDHWASSENVWEGIFGLFASIIISLMGAALLRVSKLQDKWRVKLARALESSDTTQKDGKSRFIPTSRRVKRFSEKYAMFVLPLITVLREGLEAVVFIGGVGVGSPASAFPLPVLTGILAGSLIGLAIYKGSNFGRIQVFLIVSTCFLYLVAAGLFSKAVWYFEADKWNKAIGGSADETGAGPGSYDIRQSVWHVNCCSPTFNGGGGWGIFNAILGWTNSATYGSVISYNLYWVAVIVSFLLMRHSEKHGSIPFLSKKSGKLSETGESRGDDVPSGSKMQSKTEVDEVGSSSSDRSIRLK